MIYAKKNQKPFEIVPNQNLSFPIGTIVTVEKLYQVLKCGEIFDETKKKLIAVLSGLPGNRMPGEGNTFPLPEPFLFTAYAWWDMGEHPAIARKYC